MRFAFEEKLGRLFQNIADAFLLNVKLLIPHETWCGSRHSRLKKSYYLTILWHMHV